jgi:hypothetical protein
VSVTSDWRKERVARAALTLVVITLQAAPLLAQQQQQQDPLPGILATMSSLPGTIPAYYPAGSVDRAKQLQAILTRGVDFYRRELGVDQPVALALLGPAEWRAWNPQYTAPGGAPYARMLPGVSRTPGRPPTMVLPAQSGHALSDIIRRMWTQSPELAALGPSADSVADRYAALVGFHELGHVYTAADSVLPAEGWFNEFLATYLEYAFLRARQPDDARLWDTVCTALLNHLEPQQTSLAKMHGGGGPDTYVWYHSSLQTRVREVYDAHGLEFYRKVRMRRREIGPHAKAPLIQTLEPIAPGFLAWEAKYHSGPAKEGKETPKR